jgi:aquaporin Z
LTVLTMAYAIGHVSGCHLNPAVTLGLVIGGRFKGKDLLPYVVAQVAGATAAAALLLAVANGKPGFDATGHLAANGYGEHSPDGYGLLAVAIVEFICTVVFLHVIIGATSSRGVAGFGGLAIGLTLTLLHLISIPVSNTSINPARSLGVAWFAGNGALTQVWVFLVVPVVAALLAGLGHALVTGDEG